MPATTHKLAAVVSPRTEDLKCIIAPAPRKPMPVMTPAAIRAGSADILVAYRSYMCIDVNMTSVEPTHKSICVLKPAALP